MLYQVNHSTCYAYPLPVVQSFTQAHLTPRAVPGQQVREHSLQVTPLPAFLREHTDYFGNQVSTFAVFERHVRFTAVASSVVEVQPEIREFRSSPPWESVHDSMALPLDSVSIAASEFIFDSPYVFAAPALQEYAWPSFAPGRPLLSAVEDLTRRIHAEFTYQPESTSIDTPLLNVLRDRRGVCQDFAHIMIGVLRSLRLPARYVSGYIRSEPRLQGAAASHAWVQVFDPVNGWVGFDPTNNMLTSDAHITVAWGRDYGDVTPVKGLTLGGGGQSVEVEVSVRAIEN